jgi:photosystem II cytochrome c550
MLKRYVGLVVAIVVFAFQAFAGSAVAVELDAETRTVPLNKEGEMVTLSLEQVQKGQQLFNNVCSQCHRAGETTTDPNINLSPEALSRATPSRNNIKALIDYMKHPTTYDGLQDISELHPSNSSADIFPEMRNLTDDDLYNIAGHILLQPKVKGDKWAGGKAFY